jgi:dipeptidyl aminopeptidase/acylaminoacyl peptidase
MGAPYLIICSEKDDLAPYQIICNFAQRLQDLGGEVKLVKLNDSPHIGLSQTHSLFFCFLFLPPHDVVLEYHH